MIPKVSVIFETCSTEHLEFYHEDVTVCEIRSEEYKEGARDLLYIEDSTGSHYYDLKRVSYYAKERTK